MGRLHLAGRRRSYATEAVRALHHAFANHLDEAAEDLDRAAVVRALDALQGGGITRMAMRRAEPKGAAIISRTAAYGRAAFGWAIRRGSVSANPFAALPIVKGAAKRERVLSDMN